MMILKKNSMKINIEENKLKDINTIIIIFIDKGFRQEETFMIQIKDHMIQIKDHNKIVSIDL